MEGVRKALGQLRSNFSPQDSQQQVIDQLETSISEILSQLLDRAASPSTRRNRRHVSPSHIPVCMYMYVCMYV